MMNVPPVNAPLRTIGTRIQSASARKAAWKEALLNLDVERVCITPEEAWGNPTLACRLRAAILQRTYRNDYHTDTRDIPRLARAVREHKERVLFWGDPSAISEVRKWFANGAAPSDAELNALDFGTASTLNMEDVYGPGYAEFSRTGSMCSSIAAAGPILADIRHLLQGDSEQFTAQHTFVALPRNRRTTAEVRGGAAVHRLHVRLIASAFWGLAPWYLMQGGVIEVLDYREIYRDPDLIADLNSRPGEIWVDSDDSAAFIGNLLALNFGEEVRSAMIPRMAGKGSGAVTSWQLCHTGPPHLQSFCPAIIRPADTGSTELATLIGQASDAAATAVFVPLDQQGRASVQHWLSCNGFQLSAIVPAKPAAGGRSPVLAMWCRPKPGISCAEPYYFSHRTSGIEQEILKHLRSIYAGENIRGAHA
jgi:hypothetical protein